MKSLILTVLGPDRPGLVERLGDLVVAHQGNWVESRMAHLGGQFAGILRVALASADQADSLTKACAELETEGLRVQVASADHLDPPPERRIMTLELVGQDRAGIVRQVAQVLAAHHVNVEELTTGVESAPMSGEALFTARARLGVPQSLPIAQLRADVERIAADLMVDISLAVPAESSGS